MTLGAPAGDPRQVVDDGQSSGGKPFS